MSTHSDGDCVSVVRRITCVGAGYEGGPTCAMIANKCPHITVTCVDTNRDLISSWNSENMPFYEDGLEDIVMRCRGTNLFFSCDIPKAIREADLIFISVNALTNLHGNMNLKTPDLKFIESVARSIAIHAEGPKIVVEKSTVPDKAVECIIPILRDAQTNNTRLKFQVLSNPQFMAEGRIIKDLSYPDRVLIRGEDSDEGKTAVNALVEVYSTWVEKEKIIATNSFRRELSNKNLSIVCTSCNEGKATTYCEKCPDSMCTSCMVAHQKLRSTRSHVVIELNGDISEHDEKKRKDLFQCEYDRKTFNWFCEGPPVMCDWCGDTVVGRPRRGLCRICFGNSPKSQYSEFVESVKMSQQDSTNMLAHLPLKLQEALACDICYKTLADPVKLRCCNKTMCRSCSVQVVIAQNSSMSSDLFLDEEDEYEGLIERVNRRNARGSVHRPLPLTERSRPSAFHQMKCPYCRYEHDGDIPLESDITLKALVHQISLIQFTSEDLSPLLVALKTESNDKAAKIAAGRGFALCLDALRRIFSGKQEVKINLKLSADEENKRQIEYEWREGERNAIRKAIDEEINEKCRILAEKASKTPLQILTQEKKADLNFCSRAIRMKKRELPALWESSLIHASKIFYGRSFTLQRSKQVCALKIVKEYYPERHHSFEWLLEEEELNK